jgi:hypothetical protein
MLRARGVDEAGPVEITLDRQFVGVVRVEIAAVPLRRRVQGWPVAQECDPPMAVGDEMLHRFPGCRAVGGQHGRRPDAAGGAVDEHDRYAALQLASQIRVVGACRHDDQAVDPAAQQPVHQLPLNVGVAVRACRQHQAPVGVGDLYHPGVDGRREGVAHVVEDNTEADGPPVPAAQRVGGVISLVPQLADGRPHPGPGLRRRSGFVIDHPRNRLEADTRTFRDVVHRRAVASLTGWARHPVLSQLDV